MHHRTSFILVLCLFLLNSSPGLADQDAPLTILYTSDLSARYESVELDQQYQAGWARLASLVKEIRLEDTPVLLLDPGDYLNEKRLMCQIESAERPMQMLNELHYDSMGVGMDELNWGSEGVLERLGNADFPIVCTNLAFADTEELLFWPYWVIQHAETRLAILGVLDESVKHELIGMHMQDLQVLPPAVALHSHVDKLSPIVDLIIVLSYMNDDSNRELAKALPQIDIIIGGYGHEEILDPIVEGRTVITHAGSGANQIGRLDVRISADKTLHWKHEVLSVDRKIPPDPIVNRFVEDAVITEQVLRAEVLGQITTPLKRNQNAESALGDWMADAMRATVGADIALQNNAGIRKDLPEGLVTQGDLFDLNYYNTITTFELTGSEVLQVLEQNCRDQRDLLHVSGLSYTYSPGVREGKRVVEAKIAKRHVDPGATYLVATNHFVAALAQKYFGFDLPDYRDTRITLYESQVEALRAGAGPDPEFKPRIQVLANHSSR